MRDLKFDTFMLKRTTYLFLLLIFCFQNFIFSQVSTKELKKQLASVTDIESAKVFIKEHPEYKTKIYTYNEEKHTNSLSKELFSKSAGSTLETEEQSATTLYKIISITPTLHYRASYIYLDGKKLPEQKIDSLRKEIMHQLEQGKKFSYLAGTFSMDRKARQGGDLGWFTENKMFPEFVEALKENKTNTIYELDFPDKKRFYTVKKTFEPKEIRLLQVLKITFEKEKKKRLINAFGSK